MKVSFLHPDERDDHPLLKKVAARLVVRVPAAARFF